MMFRSVARRLGPPLALIVSIASMAPAQPPGAEEVNAQQVRLAIERGVKFLQSRQNNNGQWRSYPGEPGGLTALCTLALLNAGVDPQDPAIQSSLRYLRTLEPTRTYSTALTTMALCAAEPRKDLVLIGANVKWLENTQVQNGPRKGAWGYVGDGGDNSNSQFALLALHEAERVGVPVSDQTWRSAHAYWQRAQNADGSFGYQLGHPGSGAMTCAGIGALVITGERLQQGDARVVDGRVECCGRQADDASLDRAMAWLGANFSVQRNPRSAASQPWLLYYLYGVERVGRLTAQRFIGEHDWYREGADMLVRGQDALGEGFWKQDGGIESIEEIATSFALLFLSKGRRPVLVSKLKREPADDWNHHRHDLAHLTSYVEQRWRRDLTWQIIDAESADVNDLLQTPVLFISGDQAPRFTFEQIKTLRAYIDGGGFIFAEACCDGEAFDRGFRDLMERVFPEQEIQLRLLPPEHPVWMAEERVDPKYIRPLWGVDIGCRTSVVYCPEDLSCRWELARPSGRRSYGPEIDANIDAARAIGVNVLAYATGRELRFKDEIPSIADAGADADRFERAKLYVAKLKHSGGFNAAPNALANLLRFTAAQAGVRISTDRREVGAADAKIYSYPLLFMHGRNAFRLSETERAQLRAFVDRGGMIFADSICSSEAFAASLRREMAAVFQDRGWERIRADHSLFTPRYGGYDLAQVALHEPVRRADGSLSNDVRQVDPFLEGIPVDGRYGVIFSPYDLSCALEQHGSLECKGYTSEDAARIGLNVILYALQE